MTRFRKVRYMCGLASVIGLIVGVLLLGQRGPATAAANEIIPGAEIVHVVSNTEELLPAGERFTTEVWIDQISGDTTVRIFDPDGTLRFATLRQGLSLKEYDAWTGSIEERRVLTASDPVLQSANANLGRYRQWLTAGTATLVAEEPFRDMPAVKVRAWVGTELEHEAYLDPTTLFPLGTVRPDGTGYAVSYLKIETYSRAEQPTNAFQFDLPAAKTKDVYEQLSSGEVAAFKAYPLWSLGERFENYTLSLVQRFSTTGRDPHNVDAVYFHYRLDTNPTQEIEVINRGPLTKEERAGLARAEAESIVPAADTVVINGEAARVRQYSSGFRLEIERQDSVIYLWAPDRSLALQAAGALKMAN